VIVLDDPEALASHVADWLTGLARAKQDAFAIALSGGTTPRLLYRTLAARDDFPWTRAEWYFGDERFVPPDDPMSNFRMAREAMLFRAPRASIHPIPTLGLAPDDAARRYEDMLRARARPLFDVVLLGLGTDGHTASLFPGSAVLEERTRLVCVTENGRITLTYPALESASHIAFLVAGAEKRAMLARLASRDQALPAARVKGAVEIFADKEAAG